MLNAEVRIPKAIKAAPVSKLLALHGFILDELRTRSIVRSSNNPSGDYAEYLFARAFRWQLTSNSNSGYDAVGNGKRYQIKCRRMTRHNRSRQLSSVRKLEKKQFDFLAAVIFNEDYSVYRAVIVPRSLVRKPFARFSSHVNGWILRLTDDVWKQSGVKDVTKRLKRAEGKL